jgi:hypothetical protein
MYTLLYYELTNSLLSSPDFINIYNHVDSIPASQECNAKDDANEAFVILNGDS